MFLDDPGTLYQEMLHNEITWQIKKVHSSIYLRVRKYKKHMFIN